jgi:hypothetical protein
LIKHLFNLSKSEAIHKIADFNEGDFVGCMYESPYYGCVLSKNDAKRNVKIQFYTRSGQHKIYISKKKDTDVITEKRQGKLMELIDKDINFRLRFLSHSVRKGAARFHAGEED